MVTIHLRKNNTDMREYYISDGTEKFGPYSIDELKNISINENTLIWHKGLDKWKLARNVKAVNDILLNKRTNKSENEKGQKDEKEKKYKFNYLQPIIFLIIILISLGIWFKEDLIHVDYNFDKNIIQSDKPSKIIESFFKSLNNNNYKDAYALTNHSKWNTYENFKNFLKNWKSDDFIEIKGKSYYSKYSADTIIYVKYIGTVDQSLVRKKREFDFHLKKYEKDWKIVRLYNPQDPEFDVLKKNEVPITAKESVNKFLYFLDKSKYVKAYKLTNNPKWGGEEKFTSINSFGCISKINISSIEEIRTLNRNLKIINAKYYAIDNCNGSNNYDFNFYVSNESEYWKIIKVMSN